MNSISKLITQQKIIIIALLATFSFVLFTQHINADTYSLSGTVSDVNYDSGSITIAPEDGSNYAHIKGFSGNQLKTIAKTINNTPNTVYDFKLKNKNEIISYKINKHKTENNNPFRSLGQIITTFWPLALIILLFMFISIG